MADAQLGPQPQPEPEPEPEPEPPAPHPDYNLVREGFALVSTQLEMTPNLLGMNNQHYEELQQQIARLSQKIDDL
jgi:hypothetical protein